VLGEGTSLITLQATVPTLAATDWAVITYAGSTTSNALQDLAGNLLAATDDQGQSSIYTFAQGSSGNNVINLSARAVTNGEGPDIQAGAGDDTVTGTAGRDRINGGTGVDSLIGGQGGDEFVLALPGTGADGAVTLADVERAASATPPAVAPTTAPPRVKPSGFDPAQMRQAIAAAMGRSKREIPHYYLAETVDFAAAQAWLDGWNRDRPPKDRLLSAVLLLKATAPAPAGCAAPNSPTRPPPSPARVTAVPKACGVPFTHRRCPSSASGACCPDPVWWMGRCCLDRW
jgi:hypothetical protein